MSEELIPDTYLTLEGPAEGIYKEKGSKFLGFAYPARDEEEVKAHLEASKKTYYDARHHCYAYILGFPKSRHRAQDDGEPNNSAGVPILGQIRSRELTDTLVIVVRYFGGTKLGVSGLVRAYKTAAAEALEEAHMIEKQLMDSLEIRFAYPQMNEVMKVVKQYGPEIGTQSMELDCRMELRIRRQHFANMWAALGDIEGICLE